MTLKSRRGVLLSIPGAALALTSIEALAEPDRPVPAALNFTMKDIAGADVPLSRFAGKVIVVVNVASFCGNTPQYGTLQKLYETYKEKGLVILGFPANEFGKQEPGTNAEIKEFCDARYRVTFPMFSKVVVKGEGQTPFFKHLTSKETNPKFGGDIEWNFAKFILNRRGEIIGRVPAGKDPASADVVRMIEAALAEKL